jgi:hypothetical protein
MCVLLYVCMSKSLIYTRVRLVYIMWVSHSFMCVCVLQTHVCHLRVRRVCECLTCDVYVSFIHVRICHIYNVGVLLIQVRVSLICDVCVIVCVYE